MELMTPEEFDQSCHDYLANFIEKTKHDKGNMTRSVKTTMAQFLQGVKREFHLVAKDGFITYEDLLNCQIDELRRCVIDLQSLLNQKDGKQ